MLAAFNEDSDRMLSSAEFRIFLDDPSFHHTWTAQLSDQSGRSRFEIKPSRFAQSFTRVEPVMKNPGRKVPWRSRKLLQLDEMRIQIRSHRGSRAVHRDLIGFLRQHFAVSDEDNDELLSEENSAACHTVLDSLN